MRVNLASPLCSIDILAEALGAKILPVGTPCAKVGGIATHAQEVCRGDLFLAVRGKQTSGVRYIGEALSGGAAAVLSDTAMTPPAGSYWWLQVEDIDRALLSAAAYWRRRFGARVIAVAGSSGKTTVKELLAALLSEKYTVRYSEGNYNSSIGMPLALLSMERADVAVLELGINAVGEMEAMSRALAPNVALLTNVGSAHVGQFSGFEELLAEKRSVTRGLVGDGLLLLPESIPFLKGIAPYVWRVGVGGSAEVRAEDIRYGSFGTLATVSVEGRRALSLAWPVAGRIGLSCLLFAAAVGVLFGLDDAEIIRGVARAAENTPRMRRILCGERVLIDDTYNASPEAMLLALEGLSYMAGGRPIAAVLGDMHELGDKRQLYHETVGMLAAGSNPSGLYLYGESALDYARGAHRAGLAEERIHIFGRGEEAALAAHLASTLPPSVTVLFKASRRAALDRVVTMLKEILQ